MIDRLLSGMDGEQASEIIGNLDQEMIETALSTGIEEELVPHLHEVRQRAVNDDEPAEEVRAHYESLSDEEQTKRFNQAAADIMETMVSLREEPTVGMEKLKERLRDPWTVEALLLVFDHDEMPPEAVSERKDYASGWLKYVGVHVIPEVYTRGDARDMIEQFHPDKDPDAVLDSLGVGADSDQG